MKTFEELGVSEQICKAIEELGFVQPMPVQEEVIPYLISPEGRDVIALAQTGTGKTAAFGIPLLERIDTNSRETQALVLSPTRELCLQITDDIRDFVAAERESKSENDRQFMTVSIRADQDVRMGIITDVKQELRRCSALKIMYSARKGGQ